jgi:hypothetical protein
MRHLLIAALILTTSVVSGDTFGPGTHIVNGLIVKVPAGGSVDIDVPTSVVTIGTTPTPTPNPNPKPDPDPKPTGTIGEISANEYLKIPTSANPSVYAPELAKKLKALAAGVRLGFFQPSQAPEFAAALVKSETGDDAAAYTAWQDAWRKALTDANLQTKDQVAAALDEVSESIANLAGFDFFAILNMIMQIIKLLQELGLFSIEEAAATMQAAQGGV